MKKLKLLTAEIFEPEPDLVNALVKKESSNQLSLENEKQSLLELYNQLKTVAGTIDSTLQAHTEALHKKSLHKIEELEKKILKAEKKKFETQQRQLHKLKQQLFPNNNFLNSICIEKFLLSERLFRIFFRKNKSYRRQEI